MKRADTGPPPLRHNRNYRWILLAQAVSQLGDEVLDTALMLWFGLVAGGQAWGPAGVAGVLVARTVPTLLFSLIGGVYSDRLDRRRIMLTADAARGLLVGGLALMLVVGTGLPLGVRLAAVYTVVMLSSIAALFFNPARYGLLATVVADADRERMGSVTQGTAALAGIVGPSLAAGLLAVTNASWSLLFTAGGFALSFAAVARVRVAATGRERSAEGPGRARRVWSELVTGLRFIAGNRLLRIMLATTVLATIGIDSITVLDVFFVMRNLHAPVQVYGFLGAAFAIGSLVGAALMATFASRLRASRVYAYGYVGTGLLLAVYSRMTEPVGAVVVLFLIGLPVAAFTAMIGPLIMRNTPEQLIGRVSSMFQQASQFAALIVATVVASLAATVLRDLDADVAGVHFGTYDTIFLSAGLLIAATGVWAGRLTRGT